MEGSTRRQFLAQTGGSMLTVSLLANAQAGKTLKQYTDAATAADPKAVIAALGDALIPTEEPDYPGYRRFEKHGISDEVVKSLKGVAPADFTLFNAVCQDVVGKTFLEAGAKERAAYLEFVIASAPAGAFGVTDYSSLTHADQRGHKAEDFLEQAPAGQGHEKLEKEVADALQRFLRLARTRVMVTFYRNFPYHKIERDAKGNPVVTDEEHQIINPNKTGLTTGWDIAGFRGPLSFREEMERRARFVEIHWHPEGEKQNLG